MTRNVIKENKNGKEYFDVYGLTLLMMDVNNNEPSNTEFYCSLSMSETVKGGCMKCPIENQCIKVRKLISTLDDMTVAQKEYSRCMPVPKVLEND